MTTNEQKLQNMAELVKQQFDLLKDHSSCNLNSFFEIESIKGIKGNASMTITKTPELFVDFHFRARNIQEQEGSNEYQESWEYFRHFFKCKNSPVKIAEQLKLMIETIDALQFNIMTNQLCTPETINLQNTISEFFTMSKAMVLSADQCCVCLNETNYKTNCNHTICVPCADQIKVVIDDDDCCVFCPLCRSNIQHRTQHF
jgi:hypothetical protein